MKRKSLTTTIAWIAITFCLFGDVCGYQEDPQFAETFENDRAGFINTDADLKSRLQELRQSLQSASDQINFQLESQTDSKPERSFERQDDSLRMQATTMPPATNNNEALVAGIYEDMKLLQRLIREKRTASPVPAPPTNQNQSNVSAPVESPPQGSTSKQTEPTPGTPKLDNTFLISAKRVVPDVVDQLELGNSLFLAGHMEQALEAYTNARKKRLSTYDLGWGHFMTACCYRRAGSLDQAEAIYREVANEKNQGVFATQAKDWLNFVRRKKASLEAAKKNSKRADELLELGRKLFDEHRLKQSN